MHTHMSFELLFPGLDYSVAETSIVYREPAAKMVARQATILFNGLW